MKITCNDIKTQLKITLGTGAAAFLWSLVMRSEIKNQVWLGLSRNQMILLAILGLGLLGTVGVFVLISYSRKAEARLVQIIQSDRFARVAAWSAGLWVMVTLGGLLSAVPAYRILTLRLLPIPAWAIVATGQLFIFRAACGLPLYTSGGLYRAAIILVLLLWPFLFLWAYVFPINGKYVSIGNDFIPFYYVYKPILLASLTHLHLPLWSPGEAAGFPFAANPFSQSFYPLNIPLALFYKLAGGFSILDYQRYTILAISIFCLGLYCWLRSISIQQIPALAAALVMSSSFKPTELLRWPNAIHSAAWFPWILLTLTLVFKARTWKTRSLAGFGLAVAWISLLTAGYPYFIYYSLFLVGPYTLAFLIPRLRRLFPFENIYPGKGLASAAFFSALALAICLPYLLQVNQLLNQTTHRAGGNFGFSTANQFSILGTLGSFFFPPTANTEGTYFFGSAAVLITLAFLIVPNRHLLNSRCLFIVWIGLISWITYGSQSGLFLLLWKILPFFSRLREWGRLNIILVPILAWIFALALQALWFQRAASLPLHASKRDQQTSNAIRFKNQLRITLGGLALLSLGFQIYAVVTSKIDPYWTKYFLSRMTFLLNSLSAQTWISEFQLGTSYNILFIAFGIIAAIILIFLSHPGAKVREQRAIVIISVLAVINTGLAGPYLWTGTLANPEARVNLNLDQISHDSFFTTRSDAYYLSNNSSYHTGYAGTNWYLDTYTSFRDQAAQDETAVQELLGITTARKLFFSSRIDHTSVRSFLEDADQHSISPEITFYNGDRLVFIIDAPAAGYVSFIDNWLPGWAAFIDGDQVPIERLFGTFKSIALQPGKHQIEFRYQTGLFPVNLP